ncbi:MAG: hypothetical protein Q9201_006026 [Fulgogasparrea decipioides]
MQVADNLWQQYAAIINQGFANKIVIDPMVTHAIGTDGISFIAERFKSMIQAPVKVSGGVNRPLTISPAYLPDGRKKATGGELKPNSKGKKDKIARPPNAFILYRQHHHSKVVDANPGLHNNQISIMLGQQWQKETAETKAQFKLMAEDIKKKHLHAHPDYQYQPRKPTEKKRRMTRRKAEKANAQITSATANGQVTSSIEPKTSTAVIPKFEKTTTGNAIFTLGDDYDDDEDDAVLAAMIEKHNGDLLTFTNGGLNPTTPAAVFHNPTPVIFHENTQEVQDDTNFYGNLIDFDNMYPLAQGQLTAEEHAMLDRIASSDLQAQEQIFDQRIQLNANAELARFSNVWDKEDLPSELRA